MEKQVLLIGLVIASKPGWTVAAFNRIKVVGRIWGMFA